MRPALITLFLIALAMVLLFPAGSAVALPQSPTATATLSTVTTTSSPSPSPSPTTPTTPPPTPTTSSESTSTPPATPTSTSTLTPFPTDSAQTPSWLLLENNPDFDNFTSLITDKAPPLMAALNATGSSNLTVFAPPNWALASLYSNPLFGYALANPNWNPVVAQFLASHVANATINTTAIPAAGQGNLTVPSLSQYFNITLQRAADTPPSSAGPAANVSATNGTNVWANDARIIVPDIVASNGYIQVIDRVFDPAWWFASMIPPLATGPNTTTITASSSMTETTSSSTTTETSTTTPGTTTSGTTTSEASETATVPLPSPAATGTASAPV